MKTDISNRIVGFLRFDSWIKKKNDTFVIDNCSIWAKFFQKITLRMKYKDKYLAPEVCVLAFYVEQGFAWSDDSNLQDPKEEDPNAW